MIQISNNTLNRIKDYETTKTFLIAYSSISLASLTCSLAANGFSLTSLPHPLLLFSGFMIFASAETFKKLKKVREHCEGDLINLDNALISTGKSEYLKEYFKVMTTKKSKLFFLLNSKYGIQKFYTKGDNKNFSERARLTLSTCELLNIQENKDGK